MVDPLFINLVVVGLNPTEVMNTQILRLFWAKNSLKFRQLQSVESL